MSPLMPDPAEVRFYGIDVNYPEYRIWWNSVVNGIKPTKRRTRRGVPDPAVIDDADPELG